MKKKSLIIIFLSILNSFFSQNLFAKNECTQSEIINLRIFEKNNYKLYSYSCNTSEGIYLKNFLGNSNKRIFLNEFADFAAKESPELLAVSVYKARTPKPPILITIHRAYYCCTPQLEGNIYKVNLYQIIGNKNNFSIRDVTNIFGENSEGFEGQSEGQVFYKYKNIASIKEWLEVNYK